MFRAAEEFAYIIAEPAVPLFPTVSHETAHLVKPSRIPGSAIIFVPASAGSDSMSQSTGGFDIT